MGFLAINENMIALSIQILCSLSNGVCFYDLSSERVGEEDPSTMIHFKFITLKWDDVHNSDSELSKILKYQENLSNFPRF